MSKSQSTETVKVVVRIRPMNSKEQQRGCKGCMSVDKGYNQVSITKLDEPGSMPKQFAFDACYDVDSLQRSVYDESAFPLVESVIEGYNGTIFAYGQTGCGKTHTMMGEPNNAAMKGIIPNCFDHIFGFIDGRNDGTKFLVRCSYLEIYNEEIRDLLVEPPKQFVPGYAGPKKLELKEDPNKGIFVKDLTWLMIKSIPEIEKAMLFGSNNRKTAETDMNNTSSRSHSIFTIYIETAFQQNGEQRIKAGKLNLVDLAGSEKLGKTNATGQTKMEGIKINLSLTALGNVISALVDGKSQHIPYRDSKLTRLLQDSLGGNTKTVMIAAVSPADYNYDETLSTLRYASRAKAIKNKPKINEDPKDALLKEYEDEIKKLKEMLQSMGGGKQVNLAGGLQNLQKQMNNENIMMDVPSIDQNDQASAMKKVMRRATINETVEDLLAKLEQKGKRIQILEPGQQEENNQIKDQLQDELRQKEQALESEKIQKEQLAQLIQELEKKVVGGGEALQEKERAQIQKQREMQLQLSKQKKKEKMLLEEKRKKEEEIMLVEQNYKSLQEEVEANRDIIKMLREKYKASQVEIADLKEENQGNKEDQLELIRQQDKDLKFANKINSILLSDHEMYKIKDKAQWDDNKLDWKIPLFYLNQKDQNIAFPTINALQRVNQLKDEREIGFEQVNQSQNLASMSPPKGKPPNGRLKQSQNGLFDINKSKSNVKNLNDSVGSLDDSQQAYSSTSSIVQGNMTKTIIPSSKINYSTMNVKSSNNNNVSNEVPERRKKYLQNNNNNANEYEDNDAEQFARKQKNNVHLVPIQGQQQLRNASQPPKERRENDEEFAQHPIQFAPSPQVKGGKFQLDKIDHQNFKLGSPDTQQQQIIEKLQSPNPIGMSKKKQLDPIVRR